MGKSGNKQVMWGMEPLLGLSKRRVSRCTACPGYSGAQPEITPQRRRVETLYNRLNEAIHRHRKFTLHWWKKHTSYFFLSLQCRANQGAGIYADFSCKQLGVANVYNTPVTSVPVRGEKQYRRRSKIRVRKFSWQSLNKTSIKTKQHQNISVSLTSTSTN